MDEVTDAIDCCVSECVIGCVIYVYRNTAIGLPRPISPAIDGHF